MIEESRGEHLCLVFEPPEGAGVHDAVAVALKVVAIGMSEFRKTAPERPFHREAKPADILTNANWGHRSNYFFCGRLDKLSIAARLTAGRVDDR